MSPRLWVTRPTESLSAISATAAATETSAVRRCGVMRGRLRRESVAAGPARPPMAPLRKSHRIGAVAIHTRASFRATLKNRGLGAEGPLRGRTEKGGAPAGRLQVSAERLLALDRFEQRLEVPLAEAARAVALDHFEEQR